MKWLIKPKKPKPLVGDTREFNRFCLFPTRAFNSIDGKYYKVWLEFIRVYQVYIPSLIGQRPWTTKYKTIIPKVDRSRFNASRIC